MSGTGKTHGQALLTARFIESLKAEAEPYRWKEPRPSALGLRVAPNGLKTFDVAYRVKGEPAVKRTTIARYGDIAIDEARTRANALTSAARKGKDLIAAEAAARDAKAKAITLGALLELYISRHIANRLRSARSVASILRRVLEPLASTPAANVKRGDLLDLLEGIAADGHLRAAGHARTLIGGLCKWSLSQDRLEHDPSRGLPAYDQGTPRDRVLTVDEVHSFWSWLETLAPVMRDALRVQLATGCRIGEVGGILVSEIDQSKWLWVLPAQRSKNKKARTTPLIGVARTIVEERIKEAEDGILFPTERGGAHTSSTIGRTLNARRSRMPIEVARSHDLRRTAVSIMFDLGIAKDTIGAIIGHGSDDDRGSRTLLRHYKKTDQIALKRRALEAYDAHLQSIISGQVLGDNVVAIRA